MKQSFLRAAGIGVTFSAAVWAFGSGSARAAESPVQPPALSVLESLAGDRCAWKHVDVRSGATETIAEFAHGCSGGSIAWNRDATVALALFRPQAGGERKLEEQSVPAAFVVPEENDYGTPSRIYSVDVRAHRTTELRLPVLGELSDVGILPDGGIVALTVEEREPTQEGGARFFEDGGKRIAVEGDEYGISALARALRWQDDAWVREESVPTSTGFDEALGVQALRTYRVLHPDCAEVPTDHPGGHWVEDKALLAKLAPFAPHPAAGASVSYGWMRFETTEPPSYVLELSENEFGYASGGLVFSTASGLAAAPQLAFTGNDFTEVAVVGPWVLMSAANSGRFPHLYDVRSAKLVYFSKSVGSASFWPAPGSCLLPAGPAPEGVGPRE